MFFSYMFHDLFFFFMLFLLLGPFFPITFFLSSVDPSYFCIILFLEDFNLVKKPSYEYLLLILKSFSVVSFSLSPPWVIEARLLCLDYHCISIILHSSCHILKVHRFFEITESFNFTKNNYILNLTLKNSFTGYWTLFWQFNSFKLLFHCNYDCCIWIISCQSN